MREFYVDCCICGHHYDANKEDICPVCDWMYSGEDMKLLMMREVPQIQLLGEKRR